MNIILIILLFLLMIYIDIKRGIKLFLSILFNFIILMIIFYLIAIGLNPIICSLIGCFIISYIILYYVNERNIKTESSLKSVIIVLIILSFLIFFVTKISRIAGFGYESYEEINMFSYDVTIAISSALYEVYDNNKNLSKKDLFLSGMNIGRDILCTTNNTLMFAFLGEFMTLLIWFYKGDYSFLEIVNAKTFVSEMIKILFSAVGCIIVIPITAYITTETLKKDSKNN